jgi:hypothetical protein
MKTSRKYLVGAGVLAAIGGALWWNRYVILVVSPGTKAEQDAHPTAPIIGMPWSTVRSYRFTKASAIAAANAAGVTAKSDDAVYVTHHKKVVYDVFDPGWPSDHMTATITQDRRPLSGL